ncbi:MAG: hypothetical protein WDN08_11935 [Rhizomicrobium sp.]
MAQRSAWASAKAGSRAIAALSRSLTSSQDSIDVRAEQRAPRQPGLEIEIIGLRVAGRRGGRGGGTVEMDREMGGDLGGDFGLQRKRVRQRAVVAADPQMAVGRRIDQLQRQTHLVAAAAHRTFKHVAAGEFLRDHRDRLGRDAIGRHRGARNDLERRRMVGQRRQNLFVQAVGEEGRSADRARDCGTAESRSAAWRRLRHGRCRACRRRGEAIADARNGLDREGAAARNGELAQGGDAAVYGVFADIEAVPAARHQGVARHHPRRAAAPAPPAPASRGAVESESCRQR